RGREGVAGARHTLLAMRLDALVVAVAGAPAVRDLAERARRRLQRDDGAVDIAGGADLWVDEAACRREDLDRLLAEEPARHVEIVDHHVAENAARDLDIGEGRRAGIAAGDGEHLEPADPALAELAMQLDEIGIEAAVEADHQ